MRALLWSLTDYAAWAQPATVKSARQVRALQWFLFSWSAWAQSAAVLASTTGEGVGMPSVRLFGLASAIHDGGGHDR